MDANNPRFYMQRFGTISASRGKYVQAVGSAFYKSVDGGDSWKKIGEGLPELMGKLSICVSPVNSDRLYANIEAEGEKGGVYRSDNAGKSWYQVYNNRVTVARAGITLRFLLIHKTRILYMCLMHLCSNQLMEGRAGVRPNPHTDQHDLWINPDNPSNMILANDGGACISFNGGKSWSSQNNQATAQLQVICDNQFPYHIYGGQQDNSTVCIPSKTASGGIDFLTGILWQEESAFIAFDDPDKPYYIWHKYSGLY